MTSAVEAAEAKQGIAANLATGVDTLDRMDEVVFTKYIRLVLPLDGYVFWVRADLVTQSALLNAMMLNETELNQAQLVAALAPTLSIKGSFHYSTIQEQNEAETQGRNTVIFTALAPVQEFNKLQPNVIWVADYPGDDEDFDAPITFAFSQRGKYYQAADLFHYSGTAVLPVIKTQLISDASVLAQRPLIVSNSLPIWLALSTYNPVINTGINATLLLYPRFLVPDNLPPAYGVIHIEPTGTLALQSAPALDRTLGQMALCQDRVRVTLYGMDNEAALSWLLAVNQYSYDYDFIGVMNMPAVKDEKMTQPELGVIAQKKTVDFDVSYYQNVARNIARQVVKSAIVNYLPQPAVAPLAA